MSKKPPAAKRNRSGSEKRQRDCIVKFRAKLAERAAIKASAAAAGLSVGSFLRSLALAAPRTRAVHLARPDEASVNQFLGQVGRYTGNLRQLLRRANINLTDAPEASELAAITQEARAFLATARATWEGA